LVELGQAAKVYNYVDVGDKSAFTLQHLPFSLLIDLPLSNFEQVHTRKVYGFVDLLGNYGGIKNALLLLLGLFLKQLNVDLSMIWLLKKYFVIKVENSDGKMDYDLSNQSDWRLLYLSKLTWPCCKKNKEAKLLQDIMQKQRESLAREQEIGRILGSLRQLDKMISDSDLKVISQE